MGIIGVISDTHGLLRPEALRQLEGVDHIIHAGDIGDPQIIPALEAIAPVSAIRGNIDTANWCAAFPETLSLSIFGRRIFVLHDRKQLGKHSAGAAEVIVSGHSHRHSIERVGDTLFLNPGSAGPRRFRLPITLATLEIGEKLITPHFHTII